MHVHRIGQMPRGIGVGVAGVDDDTRLFSREFGEFAGSNQNVRHGSLSFLQVQVLVGGREPHMSANIFRNCLVAGVTMATK